MPLVDYEYRTQWNSYAVKNEVVLAIIKNVSLWTNNATSGIVKLIKKSEL